MNIEKDQFFIIILLLLNFLCLLYGFLKFFSVLLFFIIWLLSLNVPFFQKIFNHFYISWHIIYIFFYPIIFIFQHFASQERRIYLKEKEIIFQRTRPSKVVLLMHILIFIFGWISNYSIISEAMKQSGLYMKRYFHLEDPMLYLEMAPAY